MRTQTMRFGPGRMTPMVKRLIILNVAVFFFQMINFSAHWIPFERWFGLVPVYVVEYGYIWQVFTYQFLHSPQFLLHIVLNMFLLWMFGTELESIWGGEGFLRFYLTCGVVAGISVLAFNYGQIPTIGASGAIYGILGAFAMTWPDRMLYFFGLVPIRAKYAVLIFGGIELMMGISQVKTGIGHMAHLGGLVMGLSYVAFSDPRKPLLGPVYQWFQRKRTQEKQKQWQNQKKEHEEMIQEVNRILDEMNRVGWDQLSEEDRRKIQEYSDKLKHRDDFDEIFDV